jgi:hypothetical protein
MRVTRRVNAGLMPMIEARSALSRGMKRWPIRNRLGVMGVSFWESEWV